MNTRSKGWGATAAVVIVATGLSACGTANLAADTNTEPARLATIKGDPKVGVFGSALTVGNAVVHLLAVDGHHLGGSQSKAVVAPGRHTVTARCSVPARHALNVDELTFTARAGETYALQLHLLPQAPGCATNVVLTDTDEVVARPAPAQ